MVHWSKNPKIREKIISRMKAKLKGRTAWNKGIPQSDEAKKKNRIAHIGKVVSDETRIKMSESHRNIFHEGLFKKGQKPWNLGRNTCPKINKTKLREYILHRDKTCQICGSKKRLLIHHITPYKISKDNSSNNLITLCNPCHASLHSCKRYGRPYRKDLLR